MNKQTQRTMGIRLLHPGPLIELVEKLPINLDPTNPSLRLLRYNYNTRQEDFVIRNWLWVFADKDLQELHLTKWKRNINAQKGLLLGKVHRIVQKKKGIMYRFRGTALCSIFLDYEDEAKEIFAARGMRYEVKG